MAQIEMTGAVTAVGTLAASRLNATWVLSGSAIGKGTLVSQVKLRVFEDAGGVLGEGFFVDAEGVEIPIDASRIASGRVFLVWNETAKQWIPRRLVAGTGITITDTGNDITISLT